MHSTILQSRDLREDGIKDRNMKVLGLKETSFVKEMQKGRRVTTFTEGICFNYVRIRINTC
jgi:hypothetical protein